MEAQHIVVSVNLNLVFCVFQDFPIKILPKIDLK